MYDDPQSELIRLAKLFWRLGMYEKSREIIGQARKSNSLNRYHEQQPQPEMADSLEGGDESVH